VPWPGTIDLLQPMLDTEVAVHRITAVRRRGKILVFNLDRDRHLLLHPKLTGQLVVCDHGRTVFAASTHPRARSANPTTRVVVTLTGRTICTSTPAQVRLDAARPYLGVGRRNLRVLTRPRTP
jgi:formamidopyrimidine-DNA glycosylase